MNLEEIKHDVIVNNIANAATPGFKKDGVVISPFDEVLSAATRRIKGSETLYQSPLASATVEGYTDFSQGSRKFTNRDLDVAINGEGFFAVQTPEGIRYTRNGSFALGSDSQLTMSGNPDHLVLGAGNAPIAFPNTGGDVFVDRQGTITLGGSNVGRLQVVNLETPGRLSKVGDNLFAAPDDASPSPAADGSYTIAQKTLEMSNVNIVEEMVSMIINQRHYQIGQKMIQSQDQTLERAIHDVGRV
jgi:flagellar basal-body rod protein FlgG